MNRLPAVALFALVLGAALLAEAPEPWLRTNAYLDREAAPRGEPVRIAVVLEMDPGYHVNANPPAEDFQIPTELVPLDHPAIAWGEAAYPPGEPFRPEWAGGSSITVYKGRTVLRIEGRVRPEAPLGPARLAVTLKVQGCDEQACYPPSERTLEATVSIVEAGAPVEPANPDLFAAEGDGPAGEGPSDDLSAAFERGLPLYLGLLVLLGLGLNLTPCVFPLIPVTMSVFAQQGEGRPGRVLPLAALYALGIAATFTVVGVVAALAGQSLGVVLQQPVGVVAIVAVLAVLMASTFGAFDIQLPSGVMGKLSARRGYLGAVFMGAVMGAIAAPCVGPFLLALITFIARTGSVPLGAVSFFATGLGLGIPYIVLGTFTGLVSRFPRAGGWLVWTKRLLGMALAGLILWFVHPYIETAFFWPLVFAVFLFAAVYLGVVEGWSRRPFSKRFWIVRIVTAVVILAAGAGLYATVNRPALEWEPFRPGVLEEARADGRPVLLYFGADWCFPCKEWKYGLFADPEVIEAADGFRRIKVDLTNLEEGPAKDAARRYNSVNPPGVFVLGPDGARVAGYRNPPAAGAFLEALRSASSG